MKVPVILAIFALCFLSGCTKSCKEETPPQGAPQQTSSAAPEQGQPAAGATPAATAPAGTELANVDLTPDASGLSKSTVVMKTSKGTIKFKLYSKDAPNTVKRVAELIQSKFYNGLAFHRVVPGFVVQSGDPKSRNKNDTNVGSGGSGQRLKAEFNGRKHVRGTVAMARAADPDSADSQFYIAMGSFPHLDNNYTVFGQVVDFGEKVADKDVLDRIRQWDEIVDMHIE
jgi:cyclophilin family peptidyl-prolyl cis-trans isomerase